MKARADIHRPSAIIPADYDYVACAYLKVEDLGSALVLKHERTVLEKHMARTGGKYSGHEHGGTCHICGAWALYMAVFYHAETNSYIKTGFDCAAKMDMGDERIFRDFRTGVRDALELKAGKAKAAAILKEEGLERAWELFEAEEAELVEIGAMEEVSNRGCYDCGFGRAIDADRCGCGGESRKAAVATADLNTLWDIISKLVKYGGLSDGQIRYLHVLVRKIDGRKELLAKREAEKEAAEDCPEGRVEVKGKVLKVELRDGRYGETLKMTVKADGGFLVWGTVPSSLALFEAEEEDWGKRQRGLERGDRVTFTATITRSDRDSKFGFFKRPTKAVWEGKAE